MGVTWSLNLVAPRVPGRVHRPSNDVTMSAPAPRSAVLWTGGKDSAMALYEAGRSGYAVCCLVTFAPPGARFLAHPLAMMKMQSQALTLPHRVFTVREPFEDGYEAALRKLKDELGIDHVITGDIAEVNGQPNWIRERSRPAGVNVHTPLWGRDRSSLLRHLPERGFKARFSCVDMRWLDKSWVGRELNDAAIAELAILHEQTGLDLCGEQGEYHTVVLDGPSFRQGVEIRSFSVGLSGSLAYMEFQQCELSPLRPRR